jgi:hypothetical protein
VTTTVMRTYRRKTKLTFIGNFETGRVEELLEILEPIYSGQGMTVPEDLTAEDVATNEFIDDSIGMPDD